MTYCETGVSIYHSNSFTKIMYTGVYMILDAQNLHGWQYSSVGSSSCKILGINSRLFNGSCEYIIEVVPVKDKYALETSKYV